MIPNRDIRAVVPVKTLQDAKTRLSGAYDPAFRRGLAKAMLEDVLCALAGVRLLAGIAVVTLDREAAALAEKYGAVIFEDGALGGHTGAVAAAARRLAREGCDGMLTVPGDVPCITAAEVSTLIRAHGAGRAFSIVPAHDRRGSNAILITPPDAVPVAFGDDSYIPHLAAARSCGIAPTIVELPGIALDIDMAADLEKLLGGALPAHTRDYLAVRGVAGVAAARVVELGDQHA